MAGSVFFCSGSARIWLSGMAYPRSSIWLRTRYWWISFVTTQIPSSSENFFARSQVFWNRDLPSIGINCLGKYSRERGHSRVPTPPARIMVFMNPPGICPGFFRPGTIFCIVLCPGLSFIKVDPARRWLRYRGIDKFSQPELGAGNSPELGRIGGCTIKECLVIPCNCTRIPVRPGLETAG